MFYIFLIVIVLCITYILKSFIDGRKEQSFVFLIFTTGVTILTSASGDWSNTVEKIVAIIFEGADINELTEGFNLYYFFFGALLILASIVLYFYSKRKSCVLNINGYMRQKIESFLKKKKDFFIDSRERELNFVNVYQKIFSKRIDQESCECILEQIEEEVNAFKNETIELKRGYTGIAPIPFIMYAGTFLDRVNIDDYYEFDKIESKDYYVLRNKKIRNYPKLELKTEFENLDMRKTNVVLAISITQKITDEQLKQFYDDCDIIRLEVNNPYDNTIKYKPQLNQYVNTIYDTIEEISRRISNISTINIVCSSQSCLPLEIGKRSIDSTRVPQIVCYQFQNQNTTIKYPWGIVINGNDKGKLIKVEKVKESNV